MELWPLGALPVRGDTVEPMQCGSTTAGCCMAVVLEPGYHICPFSACGHVGILMMLQNCFVLH